MSAPVKTTSGSSHSVEFPISLTSSATTTIDDLSALIGDVFSRQAPALNTLQFIPRAQAPLLRGVLTPLTRTLTDLQPTTTVDVASGFLLANLQSAMAMLSIQLSNMQDQLDDIEYQSFFDATSETVPWAWVETLSTFTSGQEVDLIWDDED